MEGDDPMLGAAPTEEKTANAAQSGAKKGGAGSGSGGKKKKKGKR